MIPENGGWSFTVDPIWPFSIPGLGFTGFILASLGLIILTVWTYRGTRGASSQRILVLTSIRLLALVVTCAAVLRPSVMSQEDLRLPSTLVILADSSQSMSIRDQHNNMSRWEFLKRILQGCEPALQDLRDQHQVSVVVARFDSSVGEYRPEDKPNGKRTDFGEALQTLYERFAGERNLRGLLIMSDGADNGTRQAAIPIAARWRALSSPIHTFAFGQTNTTVDQRDIAFRTIIPNPSPVAVKGELRVRGVVDAPGFEDAQVTVRLFLDNLEVATERKRLHRTQDNEVELKCDAPAKAGEVRVTLKIDPLPNELTTLNNEISTYLTVTQEGISVLYVEGKYRAWEPKYIRWALGREPSIRLFETVRLSSQADDRSDPFDFARQHYDVIILGDINRERLAAGNAQVLAGIHKLVNDRGAGLLMIGGYENFGNGGYENSEIARLLPVTLDASGQIDGPVQMLPSADGMRHYLMRLAENEADGLALWRRLRPLDGMTRLGQPKPGARVFAQTGKGEPILVGERDHGAGRTLAFAGDTTWRWCNTEEGLRAHARFWRQMVFWLAKRDEAEGNIVVIPDTRRLPAGGKLGFQVKLRGKGGVDVAARDAHFDVKVISPDKSESSVPIALEGGEQRGTYWRTDAPGEYLLVANGRGVDSDGKPLDNLEPARARFLVYQDEAEMARQAADHEFLAKLAQTGGGKIHQPEDLKPFLRELVSQPLVQNKPKARLWPDWRKSPASRGLGSQWHTLTASGILVCYVLFAALLCTEWLLRRLWGFV